MKALICFVLAVIASPQALSVTATAGSEVVIQDLVLTVPEGFALSQNAKDQGTIILGFKLPATGEYLQIFAKNTLDLDMHSLFANGSEIVRDVRQASRHGLGWSVLETRKHFSAWNRTFYITSFLLEHNGASYYGYVRTESSARSNEIAETFLNSMR